MTSTTPELSVFQHRGAATGIALTISPVVATLFIGQIAITPDVTIIGVTGTIVPGTSPENPGRADLRAGAALFDQLLVLATLPRKVELVVTLTYEEASLRVVSIDCHRRAVAGAAE